MFMFFKWLLFIKFCTSQKLIVISIDGFAATLLKKSHCPFIFSLLRNSTYSRNVDPVFPTETFPNHHSISTGVSPIIHGIINNKMAELNDEHNGFKMFFHKDSDDPTWWNSNGNIVPIGIANELKGPERKTSTIFWPGSKVPYNGRYIEKFKKKYIPNTGVERLDEALDDYKSGKYNLIMVYLADVDKVAHEFGPTSVETMQTFRTVDRWIEDFLRNIDTTRDSVIILGDHGFDSIRTSHHIDIEEIFSPSEVFILSYGAFIGAYPKTFQNYEDMMSKSKDIVKKLKHKSFGRYRAYTKFNIPTYLNYHNNTRIPPILVLAHRHYYFPEPLKKRKGDHGWPVSTNPEMKTIFMGMGPRFKPNFNIGHMLVLDHYWIFCEILQLTSICSEHEGSVQLAERALSKYY